MPHIELRSSPLAPGQSPVRVHYRGGGAGPPIVILHGDGWRDLTRANGDAWMRIATDPAALSSYLYEGRLGDLRVPALVMHGARDPRTEPGELAALQLALNTATFEELPDGGHSPHSERATADKVTRIAQAFVADLSVRSDPLALLDPPARSVPR